MANSRTTLIATGLVACMISVLTLYSAIQFVLENNDDAMQMAFTISLIMCFVFLSGICAVMFGVLGWAPKWMRNIIGVDETGRSAPTGDPLKDQHVSPLWILVALCLGFFVLLFLHYVVFR